MSDEGAPWPYAKIAPAEELESAPTWECPGGTCQCHAPGGEEEKETHRILFFDGGARRMPGARCRVLEGGVLLNKRSPHADGSGGVDVEVRPGTRVLEVEWAPPHLPVGPGYPYRKRYYLDLGESRDEGVQRRLHNLGFVRNRTLQENVAEMQRTYLQPETGRPEDVAVELAAFHDDGILPPIPKAPPGAAPPQAPSPAARSSLVARSGALSLRGSPAAAPSGGAAPAGGVRPQGSVTGVQITKFRVQVRTRSGRGIESAEVRVDVGPVTKTEVTNKKGFTPVFTFTQDEVDAGNGKVAVTSSKKHHGPDPTGIDKVVPGALESELTVTSTGIDRATPGLEKDASGLFLAHVLMDAGMNRGVLSGAITRRLSNDEIQKELIFAHHLGRITLAADSEFQFDHDPASGMFDPCTAKCTIKSPAPDRWISLKDSVIGDVTLHLLKSTVPGAADPKKDILPGQRFTRDTFGWEKSPLRALDQRQVAGLIRLCRVLHRDHDVVTLYHIGVNGDTTRADCHGFGLAIDFGGCGLSPAPKSALSSPVRLGEDFFIFLHWGNVPMWDPRTVAADPGNPASWKRAAMAERFSRTDYTQDPTGKSIRLHYTLDPAPFQEPVPAGTPADLAAQLDPIALHFRTARTLFQAVYDFAIREYSDANDVLGPSAAPEPPTPIDSHQGHRTLHPDYPKPSDFKTDDQGNKIPSPTSPSKFAEKPNGRGAHFNHFHFQLGPTNYRDGNNNKIFRTK